jgi:hypothetical protein
MAEWTMIPLGVPAMLMVFMLALRGGTKHSPNAVAAAIPRFAGNE